MATRRTTPKAGTALFDLEDIDFAEFRRQQERIQERGAAAIAELVETIKAAVSEIRTIQEATGIKTSAYSLKGLTHEIDSIGYSLDADWYSSSYSC